MHWETDTQYEQICNIKGPDRFELIQRYIHFNDNNKDKRKQNENRDRFFKTGSLSEALWQNCLSQEHEEYNSKDEQI